MANAYRAYRTLGRIVVDPEAAVPRNSSNDDQQEGPWQAAFASFLLPGMRSSWLSAHNLKGRPLAPSAVAARTGQQSFVRHRRDSRSGREHSRATSDFVISQTSWKSRQTGHLAELAAVIRAAIIPISSLTSSPATRRLPSQSGQPVPESSLRYFRESRRTPAARGGASPWRCRHRRGEGRCPHRQPARRAVRRPR